MYRIQYDNVVTDDLIVEYIDDIPIEEIEEHADKYSRQIGLVPESYNIEYIKPEDEQTVKNNDFFHQLRTDLNNLLYCPIDGHESARSLSYGMICGAALARPDIAVEINSLWMDEYYKKWYPDIKGVKV